MSGGHLKSGNPIKGGPEKAIAFKKIKRPLYDLHYAHTAVYFHFPSSTVHFPHLAQPLQIMRLPHFSHWGPKYFSYFRPASNRP